MYRMMSLAMVLMALVLFVGVPAGAQEKDNGDLKNSHTGKFVSVKGKTFVMEDKGGKEHSHTLALDAKILGADGKAIRLEELKRGQMIRVTTKEGDRTTATKVEALKSTNGAQRN
jgi:hypothetical protein